MKKIDKNDDNEHNWEQQQGTKKRRLA
jgi:hypothetical protein